MDGTEWEGGAGVKGEKRTYLGQTIIVLTYYLFACLIVILTNSADDIETDVVAEGLSASLRERGRERGRERERSKKTM